MKKILFGLLISMSLLSVCYASDISVEPLLNNVYDAVNQSLWVSGVGGSVNGTEINVTNITVNDTISSPAGVNITIAPGGGTVIMGATGASSFQMFNATSVSYNCTLNATGTGITCAP